MSPPCINPKHNLSNNLRKPKTYSILYNRLRHNLSRPSSYSILNNGFHYNLMNGVLPAYLTDELMQTLKDTGCYRLFYPIESMSHEALVHVLKEHTANVGLERHKHNVRRLARLGIEVVAAYMVGFPGETLEQMERTAEAAREVFELAPETVQSYVFHVTPFPGTRLYERCRAGGLLIEDWDRDASFNWTYRFPHIVTRPEYMRDLAGYARRVTELVDRATRAANRPSVAEAIAGGGSWACRDDLRC